jgi:hypothetical protein
VLLTCDDVAYRGPYHRSSRSTFQVKKRSGFYPRLTVDADGGSAVSQAGGVLLTSTVRAAGLDVALRQALAPWRPQLARHDPAKVLIDLALTLALGGDTCSDLAAVRAEPAVFGPVASDPTLSRTIARLAGDVDRVLAAINTARARARARVWAAAGANAPNHARDAAHPREAECGSDVQAGIRLPPVVRVRRPRTGGHR